jgi:ABC-type multidrug transport system permease subunit
MTVVAFTPRIARTSPLGPVRDALAVAGRNLNVIRRTPRLLVFSTIQPLVFLVLFRYVFAGVAAKTMPGIPYVDYLMPGIFIQVCVFGAMNTAIGLASDLKSGLLERFRSLPMSRVAVLAGRTIADLARNVFVVALMVSVGFAVGFRIHNGADSFSTYLWQSLAWLAGIIIVFAPLGAWRYHHAT